MLHFHHWLKFYLLSGELATKLTGRYIKLEMFTLSFQEYLGMRNFLNKPEIPVSQAFRDYLTYGGFPKSLEYDDPDEKAAYIQDVIGQIFNKDITAHKKVRNRDTFTRVQDYLINNFAAPTNLSGIIAYLKHSEGISIKRETLSSYVRLLESAKNPLQVSSLRSEIPQVAQGRGKILSCRSRYPVRP